MASKSVADAVEARLAAVWNRCPVIGMNTEGETPHDGSPFLVVQYPVADVRRPAFSNRHYREEGAFRFVLHNRRGAGLSTALEWADELAGLFRDQKFGGVVTQVPGSPFLDDSNDQGNYFVTSFAVPFTRDFED